MYGWVGVLCVCTHIYIKYNRYIITHLAVLRAEGIDDVVFGAHVERLAVRGERGGGGDPAILF